MDVADRTSEQGSSREMVRRLIQKYVDSYNPYDGEVEQTLDEIERVYSQEVPESG